MGFPFFDPYSREQEMTFLKDEAADLQDELNAVNRRIHELESKEEPSD